MSETKTIKLFCATASQLDIEGWNKYSSSSEFIIADNELIAILQDSDGGSTGYSLRTILALDSALDRSGQTPGPATQTEWGWEEAVWDTYWRTTIAGDYLRVTGIPVGATYVLKLAGEGFDAARDTTFDASGSTNGPLVYDSTGESGTPTEQVSLVGVVDATGNIDINMAPASGETYSKINGFELILTTVSTTTHVGNIQLDMSVTSDVGTIP